jgi:hypothetical protein
MIKNEIQFLVVIFAGLLGLLLLLLLYLIGRKASEIRQRKSVERIKERMNEKMLHSILTGDVLRSLNGDSSRKKIAIEELLSHYSEVLEGTEEKTNLNWLAESMLSNHYRRNLRSIRWSTRMNALYHIEAFEMHGVKEDIMQLLRRQNATKEEKIKALTIIAQLQSPEIYELLTGEYKYLSYLEYRSILSRLENDRFDLFVLGYHSCQQHLKFAIMDLAGLKKELKYLNFTESVFSVSSGEERVRALKAVVSIGHVRKLEQYLPLLHSVNWEERMLAARLAGVMEAEHALPELVQLLKDPSWWVRSQAGQSITMFPLGKQILMEVITESDDSFARDMAWEWLNKGVLQT